jgi:hypothetical protein
MLSFICMVGASSASREANASTEVQVLCGRPFRTAVEIMAWAEEGKAILIVHLSSHLVIPCVLLVKSDSVILHVRLLSA